MFLHRPYQQILRDVIEKTLDVQIQNPVIAPASLPCLPHCIQCRLPRSIPVGIRMEQRVHRRLQSRLHHHLRNPIRHSRYTQLSFPTVGFRYFHRPHRRWKVTARRHSIPDLVQVLSSSPRSPQSTAHRPLPLLGSLSLAYTLPRPPAWKYRMALPHSSAPPIAGWLIEFGSITQPLRSIPFRELPRYYELLRPWAPLPYSRPHGSSTCGFSVRIGVPGSHVPLHRL